MVGSQKLYNQIKPDMILWENYISSKEHNEYECEREYELSSAQ